MQAIEERIASYVQGRRADDHEGRRESWEQKLDVLESLEGRAHNAVLREIWFGCLAEQARIHGSFPEEFDALLADETLVRDPDDELDVLRAIPSQRAIPLIRQHLQRMPWDARWVSVHPDSTLVERLLRHHAGRPRNLLLQLRRRGIARALARGAEPQIAAFVAGMQEAEDRAEFARLFQRELGRPLRNGPSDPLVFGAAISTEVSRLLKSARLPTGRGASAEALCGAEAVFGEFPDELRELYSLRDGMAGDVLHAGGIFSLQEVLSHWSELCRDFPVPEHNPHGDARVRPVWWSPRWLPVTGGPSGSVCIDLDPGPWGRFGQTLWFAREDGRRPVIADSLLGWLSTLPEN